MTLTATNPAAWIGSATQHTTHGKRQHPGETQFDQELQTQQPAQLAQTGVAAVQSLPNDLLRVIAGHLTSAIAAASG